MADIQKQEPIRSAYADGSIVISNVKNKMDNGTTSYTAVSQWYDGTPMNDAKCDDFGVYTKFKPTGEYLRENKPNWGEKYLEIDTIEDFRNLDGYHRLLLMYGYYRGVEVNGYYSMGDKPPLKYHLAATSAVDDGGSCVHVGDSVFLAHFMEGVDVRHFGAMDSESFDSHPYIQECLDFCYRNSFKCIIPNGIYTCSRALYISKGTTLGGAGRVHSIIKTFFRKRARLYPIGSPERAKAVIAEQNAEDSKGSYSSITSGFSRQLDMVNGHNRFYLGDGLVGCFDSDRHTNPAHPLYYPDPGGSGTAKNAWNAWYQDLQRIESRGDWVGLTGRENYSRGLIKGTDNPEIRHTTERTDSNYIAERHGCRVHSGVRNVVIEKIQVQTNSVDRGRDSGINFFYTTSHLRGNLSTYDSSCLGIKIDDCWLFEIGGDGFSIYRSVNTTIDNTIAQRCATNGFRIEGVTSTHISGCYANGCLENGYNFRGVHYSSMTACAADSCSRAYNFYNCSTITLNGCGAEASKAIYADNVIIDGAYPIYPGRAFNFNRCRGVTVLNPYASTTREQIGALEDSETLPNSTRHMRIDSCQDVLVIAPRFLSYKRWRTAPFRDESNTIVESAGRFWEFQDRLVRASFEVRGDNNSVALQINRRADEFITDNMDRTPNLDLFDPGTVPHPDGHTTAVRTLSGEDGHGGWLDGNGDPVSIERFETLYPSKNKGSGAWNKYWAWRGSLIVVRKRNDPTLSEGTGYGLGEAGYLDVLPHPTPWVALAPGEAGQFSLDIDRDRDRTSWIDGSSQFYTYAPMSLIDSGADDEDPEATSSSLFPMPIMGAVDARSRTFEDGTRIVYNSGRTGDNSIARAAHGFMGNIREDGQLNPVMSLKVPIPRGDILADGDFPLFTLLDSLNYPLFNIYPDESGVIGRAMGGDNRRMLSFNSGDRARITKLVSASATLVQCANRINNIIDRLRAHGLIMEGDA